MHLAVFVSKASSFPVVMLCCARNAGVIDVYLIRVAPVRAQSSISTQTSEYKITKGDEITFNGSIYPAFSGAEVHITFTNPDDSTFTRTFTTGSDGSYNDSYEPTETRTWRLEVSWNGDSQHEGASSQQITFIVVHTL